MAKEIGHLPGGTGDGGVGGEAVIRSEVFDEAQIPIRSSIMVALSAGLGYGFDAYAVNIYGLIIPVLVVALHTNDTTLGNISSLQLVGYMLGTIGFGWAADRWGRKDTLGVSILSYGATTALNGIFSFLPVFALFRFLTGVGGAGELAVGAPYTAEVWPKKHRALGTGGIIFSLYSVGYILAALVALFVVSTIGWQWAFILAIVPAVGVFLLRRRISESPRYLEAVARVQAMKEATEASGDEEAVQAGGDGAAPKTPTGGQKEQHLEHIWSTRSSRRRVLVGSLIYIANAVGYWAIAVFLTTFMVKKFHQTAHTAIIWAIVFYVGQFFLSFVGSMLSDKIGRRPAALLGSVIMIVAIIVGAEATTLTGFIVFIGLAVAMLGWLWGIGNTYISELFPTHLRGTGFGWCVGIGRFASIFAPTLVAHGIAAFGVTLPLLLIAPVWVVGMIGYWLGPETAGLELEELGVSAL